MSYKPLNQNKMEQSAVEWFNQQLVDRQNGNGDSRSRDEILEQAKDIELKNLLSAQSEAYLRGYNDGQKYNN
jgi:hypothetical protein